MKKSHNDYWCKNKISDALSSNCDIFEIDIVFIKDEVMLNHSWRPFKCMTYGSASKYFNELPDGKVLEIEIKTGDRRIIDKLVNLILKRKELTYIIFANNSMKDRMNIVYSVCLRASGTGVKIYSSEYDFKISNDCQIESVDLFPKNKWLDWTRM